MKRFAATTLLAGGLFGVLTGMAGTAQASMGDIIWNQQHQQIYVPHVDTSVRHSR